MKNILSKLKIFCFKNRISAILVSLCILLLIAGTAVLMASGAVKAIENIHVGDIVKSYNASNGKVESKRVLQTFENETDELVTISTLDGQQITATPGHKFYANNDWVSAEDLRAGDVLVNVNGEKVIVEQVQHEILDSPVKVYNFEVANNHTYFVGGESGITVHNSACKKSAYNSNISSEGTVVKGEYHHIASNKSIKSGYTQKYETIFDNADMKLSDPENIVFLKDHCGAHTKVYKQNVLEDLENATSGITPKTPEYTAKVKETLKMWADKLIENPRLPYK